MTRFWARPLLISLSAGVLLCLSFPPMGLWPLMVPALALYFYAAGHERSPYTTTWWGGFLAGLLVGIWVSASGLISMALLPGAVLFSYLVHLSPLFIGIMVGVLFGAQAVLYRLLVPSGPLLASVAGAALYTVGEVGMQVVFGGYYWAALSHALVAVPGVFALAPLGGALLVTFCAAWVGAALAQMRYTYLPLVTSVVVVGALVLWGSTVKPGAPVGSLSVASVQIAQSELSFGTSSPFITGAAAERFSDIGHSGVHLAIFPYNPVPGTLAVGTSSQSVVRYEPIVAPLSALTSWVAEHVAPNSTALVWTATYDSSRDQFAEVLEYYQGAARIEYKKQRLYPYTDYFPAWMLALGLARRNDALTAGPAVDHTTVGAWRLGTLDCSEINTDLARYEARASQALVSVGTDGMFTTGAPADYSLAAARYRAAENRINVVRAALNGPSAFINPDGSLEASLPGDTGGILQGTLVLRTPTHTLYNRAGEMPLFICLGVVLVLAAWQSYSRRSLSA